MVDMLGRRLRSEASKRLRLACFQSTKCSALGQARVADFAGLGREFFVRFGSRVLRGDGCVFAVGCCVSTPAATGTAFASLKSRILAGHGP
jgi:hypothetical protein